MSFNILNLNSSIPKKKNFFGSISKNFRQKKQNLLIFVNIFSICLLAWLFLDFKINVFGQNQTEILKTQYEQRKREIEAKKQDIEKNLKEVSDKYSSLNSKQTQLNAEVSRQKSQIEKVKQQIAESRVIINQLDLQIQKNQEQLEQTEKEMRVILRQIQRQETLNPLHLVLTSQNLGEAISELYNLSSLQIQASNLKDKIENTRNELEKNKKMQTEIQEQLKSTEKLLQSRQDSLQFLLSQTAGEQSKYEELLKELEKQQELAKQELEKAGAQYLAEVQNILDKEKMARAKEMNNQAVAQTDSRLAPINTQNSNVPGPSGCRFESGDNLNVSADYFGPVTSGYITQSFHCGHDGVDISNGMGTPLYAIAQGTVVQASPTVNCIGISCNNGFGNYVVVRHNLPSGRRVYAVYAHMQSGSPLSVGQSVTKGQTVGFMGCTGYTLPYPCGIHVHFMLVDESFETNGIACAYGAARCYNPLRFINPIA